MKAPIGNRSMRLQFFASLLAVTCSLAATNPATANEAKRWNIVLFLIDDMGWMDLKCQGNPLVETPHIDRFATQGVRFTNAYAAAPVCSPTRAAILTGHSPARLRITNHLPDRASFTPPNAKLASAEVRNQLDLNYTTIAERLKQRGYQTCFLGKWHVAPRGGRELFPEKQGFDINIGGCSFGGPPTFFDPYRIPTLPDRKKGEYLPDRLADEAVQFLRDRDKKDPFMLFVWNYAVHWPMEAPQPLIEKYRSRKGPGLNDTRYGAMIEALDAATGRVLAELDRQQLTDETLVIFTSDNGGFGGVADNRPLRDAKGTLFEGGIRVPTMIRWPGVAGTGVVDHTPIISMDFYATLLDAAGISGRQPGECPDGVNLRPLLQGKPLERDAIYFHYPNYAWHRSNRLGSAVRAGKYKLIEWFDDDSVELYNLETDLSEKRNLASTHPEIASQLREKLHAWRKETNAAIPPPRKPAAN